MNPQIAPTHEFFDLMADLAEDRLSSDRAARLEELLWADEANRQHYIDYMLIVTGLYRTKSDGSNDECGMMNDQRQESSSGEWRVESGQLSIQRFPSNPEFPVNDLSVPHSSFLVHPSLPSSLSSLPSSYIGGVLFSYTMALLIVGIGLSVAWVWKLPGPAQIADRSAPQPASHTPGPSTRMEFVGRITGMVDCQWSDPNTAVPGPVAVPLGRKYALAAGLMEITYETGVRVILQGPCTYEVESPTGGYLSAGKLTAKVEKKEERRTKNEELAASGSSFLLPRSYFAVRTPTATVTDLGTEFGVEVTESGNTVSHVFQGAVELQVASTVAGAEPFTCVLRENQSARIERSNNPNAAGNFVTVSDPSAKPADFVRKIVRPPMRTLDLVDVVAGGDGFSGRRDRGIDPTTGRPCDSPPQEFNIYGNGAYHRVEGLPLVDGVFIPDDRAGPVQVDSAGHTFDGFATSMNMTYGYVWAGGAVPTGTPPVVRTELSGVDYAAPGHGLIFLHANKGITFDLEAMRRANPGWKLGRFLAVAGNSEVISQGILGPIDENTAKMVCADVRVLVDGELRWYRHGINGTSGGLPIAISIDKNDRFLTLVGTDASNGIHADWTLFGDPRIELVSTEINRKEEAVEPE